MPRKRRGHRPQQPKEDTVHVNPIMLDDGQFHDSPTTKGWQVSWPVAPGSDDEVDLWFPVVFAREFGEYLAEDARRRPNLDPVVTWVGF